MAGVGMGVPQKPAVSERTGWGTALSEESSGQGRGGGVSITGSLGNKSVSVVQASGHNFKDVVPFARALCISNFLRTYIGS